MICRRVSIAYCGRVSYTADVKKMVLTIAVIMACCASAAWADSVDVDFGPAPVGPSAFSSTPYFHMGNRIVPGNSGLSSTDIGGFNSASYPSATAPTYGYASYSATFSSAPVSGFNDTPLFSPFSSAPIYGTLNNAAYGSGVGTGGGYIVGHSTWIGPTVRVQTVTQFRGRGGRR